MVNKEDPIYRFLAPCRRPLLVAHRGKTTSVRCGKCPDCLSSRASRYVDLCTIESQSSRYSYYFTLTFDEFNVPKMRLFDVHYDDLAPDEHPYMVGYDATTRYYKNGNMYRLPEYDQVVTRINTVKSNPLFQEFHNKANILPKYATAKQKSFYKNNTLLRYLRKKDAQNFIKRVRFQIASMFDETVRFVLVGEYGPTTFRPHLHGVLYFNSPGLVPHIKNIICKCWKLGAVRRPSFTQSHSGVSDYVAGYINSFSHLPDYLRGDNVKPFLLHSVRLGAQVNSLIRETCYASVDKADAEFDYYYNGCIRKYRPTSANLSTLFPRCYNYDNQNNSIRYQLYTIFDYYKKLYNTSNCSQITKNILSDPLFYRTLKFLDALEISPDDVHRRSTKQWLYIPKWYIRAKLHNPEDPSYQKLFNRIYSALSLSRHFLTFCCSGHSPHDVFNLITTFYESRNSKLLRLQYEYMQQYHERYNTCDYDVFFPGSTPNFKYPTHFDSIFDERDFRITQKIKHKELNDANLIFVDVLDET